MISSRSIPGEPAERRPLYIFGWDGIDRIERRARLIAELPQRLRRDAVDRLIDRYHHELAADLVLTGDEHRQAVAAIRNLVLKYAGVCLP